MGRSYIRDVRPVNGFWETKLGKSVQEQLFDTNTQLLFLVPCFIVCIDVSLDIGEPQIRSVGCIENLILSKN